MAGKVSVYAEIWEEIIVHFAGIAAAYISKESAINTACKGDVYSGMDAIHKPTATESEATLSAIRDELLAQAFKIVSEKWAVIDLVATRLLLDARKDGGLEDKRFSRVRDMTYEVMDRPDFARHAHFPIPETEGTFLDKWITRPSSIAQLECGDKFGYPYQQY